MAIYKAPLEDMRFIAKDVFGAVEKLNAYDAFGDATEDMWDAILDEIGKVAEAELAPINRAGDEEGCTFDNGVVRTPKGFPEAYKAFAEGGWTRVSATQEYGGMGLPYALEGLVSEIAGGANISVSLYPMLTQSAVLALEAIGTQEQRDTYLPKLVSGEWQGTMCLTESHCGTDLGQIRTKAEPNDDGSYTITGTKIFITGGDHDLTDNHIHMVLGKLPDAPPGTRGISMFLIPKFFVNEDGSLGERNAVHAGSIEHKMGMKGSCTCVMNYDGAKGWLVGQPHKGLAGMFIMMNTARMHIGLQGISLAEAAYQNAVAYANERKQGRTVVEGDSQPDQVADTIIRHPVIRQKLLRTRALTEAARALAFYGFYNFDISRNDPDDAARAHADGIVQFLTPLIKAGGTDMGMRATLDCQQVLGGHGYIREWGLEQFVRDVRIAQIYEGTNEIQAFDFVGRKFSMGGGALYEAFFAEVDAALAAAKGHADLADMAAALAPVLADSRAVFDWMKSTGSDAAEMAGAAYEIMTLFTGLSFGLMWLHMARAAADLPADRADFAKVKLATARYFFTRVVPEYAGLKGQIMAGVGSTLEMPLEAF